MLKRVLVPPRCARSRRTAMHPTTLLTLHRWRPAGPARTSLGAAAWAGEHRSSIARVIAGHFPDLRLNGTVTASGSPITGIAGVCEWASAGGDAAALFFAVSRAARRVAHDRLAAFADRYMLHGDFLLATGSVALERLHLGYIGPGELIEEALGAVLLRYVLYLRKLSSGPHGRDIYGGHLRRQHRLELIPRLNTFHYRKHEIEAALVSFASSRTGLSQLIDEIMIEVEIRRAERVHQ
jgi:hypothetical protein